VSKTNRFVPVILPIACLLLFASSCKASATKDVEGLWQGTLKVPNGELRVVFHINKAADGRLSASMDSPDQGATGIPVDECTFTNGKLSLTAKGIGGAYDGTMKNDSTIDGIWSQSGASLPLTLKRIEKVAEASRPQEPKKPYPYREEEVTVENKTAGITLAGTLTEPDSGGPFPAVVLITGSGPENRDEEVFGHKPFLVLADYLTRQGIAVLRCDDRGVGKSGGDEKTATTSDLATDTRAQFEYLKTRKDIDPKHVGLIGHSEGGLIAPIVANEAPDVAFVVMMAGPGLPGDSILMLQSVAVARSEGAPDSALKQIATAERAVLDIVKAEKDTAAAAAKLRPLLKKQSLSDQAIDAQTKAVLSPWFRFFVSYDPRPALSQLRQPVLAIDGEKDVQVAAVENLAAIETALKAGGNKDFETKELPGLNHLFQTANTGAVTEYAKIDETISPSALQVMGDWILAHAGTKK